MDFALTEIQEITRKTVRDFAEQEIIPQSAAFDESQEFPHAWAKKMGGLGLLGVFVPEKYGGAGLDRSEEHTSELQSRSDLVCRLLLEKKKQHPQQSPAALA